MQPAPDPSRTSYYVNDALYRALIANFADWQRDDRTVADPAIRDLFRRVLEREARLLDQLRYEDWLALFAPECIYWVPATPNAGDPRREVAVMFDDRRRLEDRVFRLRTGFAWSQAPASRTVRLIANVEVFAADRDDVRMVRSNFLIHEFWRRDAFPERLGGSPLRAGRRPLGDRRQAGQPHRMRSINPQPEHHSLASASSGPGLVPAIHVYGSVCSRRGWPGQPSPLWRLARP